MTTTATGTAWRLVHHYDAPQRFDALANSPRRMYDLAHWSVRRRASGKGGWVTVAFGMTEYNAKTMCNDANRGSRCFRHQVVSPDGDVFELGGARDVGRCALEENIQRAAAELPDGWMVQISVESGAGWVDLHDGQGNAVDVSGAGTINEQVSEAISYAIEHSP